MDESPTERGLRERIDAFGPEVRALLLNVFNLAEEDRVARIGELWADERTRLFAELLIDVEEDIAVRAFVIAELKTARAQVSGVLSFGVGQFRAVGGHLQTHDPPLRLRVETLLRCNGERATSNHGGGVGQSRPP